MLLRIGVTLELKIRRIVMSKYTYAACNSRFQGHWFMKAPNGSSIALLLALRAMR